MKNDHESFIEVRGAREHNLKNITVRIPRDKMVVITGLSGSGKSSLAFDTIYAEGQRRYMESLSAYARQFLGLMEKPDVDSIDGLSPAISIEQKTTTRNPRSTVGTVTEIYDYLRLLFARIGKPFCYICGKPIASQTVQQMTDTLMSWKSGTRFMILAPLVRGRKGEYTHLLSEMQKQGFVRIRIDGEIRMLEDEIRLEKNKKHTLEVVVDRLKSSDTIRHRLTDSLETALRLSEGLVIVVNDDLNQDFLFSEKLACPDCGISYDEIEPRFFSFNSPFGACKDCSGLGTRLEIDPNLVVPNPELTINDGAILPINMQGTIYMQMIHSLARHFKFDLNTPFRDLPESIQQIIFYGSPEPIHISIRHSDGKGVWENHNRFEGICNNLMRRYRQTDSESIQSWIETFMTTQPCPTCQGKRLKKEALSIRIQDKSIADVTAMSIKELRQFFSGLEMTPTDREISRQIIKEIRERLNFLVNVGLDYLTLDRTAYTLSGGEAQRIRLATQIGSQLMGVLYILDEPSIGLHQRDNVRLIETLTHLRDLGNTIIVVEHDLDTIRAADHVIDLGPRAGVDGGWVVAQGTPQELADNPDSLTGAYLTGQKKIVLPDQRRRINGNYIEIVKASGNNLKNISVRFPLGILICVTGVSGSGKSSLVNETLYPILAKKVYRSHIPCLSYERITGLEYLDKVINVDQSPIGRTPRSNPATYTGVFSFIRDLFSRLPEAKMRGYTPGRFSFNVKGGRCEACGGDGIIKVEMHFLPDIYVICETCKGKRYNRETLEVKYNGKTIADVLDMTVQEAFQFFENIPSIRNKLQTLLEVGLGYIHLGQQATTLSGGEAQRVKLATELSKRATGRTLYILDEPTTGLHLEDIQFLLSVLNRLVDKGNSVIVIEHNLDVIKTADYIIDLGPEGGNDGGRIVASGTPEEVAAVPHSYTGQFLVPLLNSHLNPDTETRTRKNRTKKKY